MKTKRIEWVDVAKGISIISVVLGHLGVNEINRVVFTFHLPVFSIISGYLLKKENDYDALKKNFERLIKPYIITCLSIIILGTLFSFLQEKTVASAINTAIYWIKASIYGAGDNWDKPFRIYRIGAIWFLLALFTSKLITNHYIETNLEVIICIISFIGWYSFYKTNIWLPLSIQAGMLLSVYLLIGYIAKIQNYHIENVPLFETVVALFFTIWGITNFKGIWLVHNYFGNGFIDFLVTISASVIILKIAFYISLSKTYIKRILLFFGRNSLEMLCLHIIDLNVLKLNNIFINLNANGKVEIITLIIIRLVYLYVGAKIIEMIKKKNRSKLIGK